MKPNEMNGPRNLPETMDAWLQEIADAYGDAIDAIPFAAMAGLDLGRDEVFHLAPHVCIKFRGLERTQAIITKATEAALSSYIATKAQDEHTLQSPHRAFAFCYVGSHLGLDLMEEPEASNLMDYLLEHDQQLIDRIRERLSCSG